MVTGMSTKFPLPTLDTERSYWADGYRFVAGIDEAGRGALAGPVMAAAVIVAAGSAREGVWREVRDSKLLTANRREELEEAIQEAAQAWSIGSVSAATIDRIGIAPSTRLAMRRAVAALTPAPDFLLIDWVKLPAVDLPQASFVKADRRIVSVAAASILAKVARDRKLIALAKRYPLYHFTSNKGYGSQAHRSAIEKFGPCREHRRTFAPLARQPTLFDAAVRGESVQHDK